MLSVDYPIKPSRRYLPNGASTVGGAHRMAQTKAKFSQEMMIQEDANDQDRKLYIAAIESRCK